MTASETFPPKPGYYWFTDQRGTTLFLVHVTKSIQQVPNISIDGNSARSDLVGDNWYIKLSEQKPFFRHYGKRMPYYSTDSKLHPITCDQFEVLLKLYERS